MTARDLKRKFLYDKYLTDTKCIKNINKLIIDIESYAADNDFIVTNGTAKAFIIHYKQKWMMCGRNRLFFEKKYKDWLNEDLYVKKSVEENVHITRKRQILPFKDLSTSQKRRRTASIRKENVHALVYATSYSLKKTGNITSASLLNESLKSPGRARKILKSYERSRSGECVKKMSNDEALKLALDSNLTKIQYLRIRQNSKQFGANIYPSYQDLCAAKNCCYPEGIVIEDNSIYCPLQNILDHTACRFILCLNKEKLCNKINIYYKLGFDGSSGQSEFKHLTESLSISDASVYIATLVPIQIVAKENNSILWQNPCPSSTRYCRPIRISYENETPDNIKKEYTRINSEIENLSTTKINYINLTVEHTVLITMLDGKSINAIEEIRSTQMCYICKATSSRMNDISLRQRNFAENLSSVSILKYGISPLHARIKFMEYILHLAYRLDLPIERRQKGTRLSVLEKEIVASRKKKVQSDFKSRLNLVVDVPKQGFGSSNNGNTSRIFFEKHEIASNITNIDHELIFKFYIILIAINSSNDIDPEAFSNYTLETVSILINLYNWWPMSPTVHKILIHGHDIINHAILPLGQLSEEAQEHRNKDFKNFKINFSRRCSRRHNLTDIFNRFLLTSDPLISHLRESTKLKYKKKEVPKEVKNLMKIYRTTKNQSDIDTSESEDEII